MEDSHQIFSAWRADQLVDVCPPVRIICQGFEHPHRYECPGIFDAPFGMAAIQVDKAALTLTQQWADCLEQVCGTGIEQPIAVKAAGRHIELRSLGSAGAFSARWAAAQTVLTASFGPGHAWAVFPSGMGSGNTHHDIELAPQPHRSRPVTDFHADTDNPARLGTSKWTVKTGRPARAVDSTACADWQTRSLRMTNCRRRPRSDLDLEVTSKPNSSRQEGTQVGHNEREPGRTLNGLTTWERPNWTGSTTIAGLRPATKPNGGARVQCSRSRERVLFYRFRLPGTAG